MHIEAVLCRRVDRASHTSQIQGLRATIVNTNNHINLRTTDRLHASALLQVAKRIDPNSYIHAMCFTALFCPSRHMQVLAGHCSASKRQAQFCGQQVNHTGSILPAALLLVEGLHSDVMKCLSLPLHCRASMITVQLLEMTPLPWFNTTLDSLCSSEAEHPAPHNLNRSKSLVE